MSDIDERNYLAITYCKQQKKAWNIGHLDKKHMTCLEQLVSLTCVSSESYFSPGGGGTPLYGLYRYVRPQRVWFFSLFGLK